MTNFVWIGEKSFAEFPFVTFPNTFAFAQWKGKESCVGCLSSSLETLSELKNLSPRVARFWVVTENPSYRDLAYAVNDLEVERVLPLTSNPQAVLQAVRDFESSHSTSQSIETFYRRSRQQYRVLEELTATLETRVKERTRESNESKNQIADRAKRMSDLNFFIMSLSRVKDIEELVQVLRLQLKPFHRIHDIFLAYQTADGEFHLTYTRDAQTFQRKLPTLDGDESRLLANALGRPFAKILAVPLEGHRPGRLMIEHGLTTGELREFQDFLNQRRSLVALSFDRLMVNSELKLATHHWQQTFDGLDDPIAIVGENYKTLRHNHHFNENPSEDLCYKKYMGAESPCHNCPLPEVASTGIAKVAGIRKGARMIEVRSYLLASSPQTFVNHYVDKTKNIELQSRMVQSEKMAAIGNLAGHIAHELSNPLSGILSLAQVLISEAENRPAAFREDLKEIEKAVIRSQDIIENLLEFSRPAKPQDAAVVDVNAVIVKTLPFLKTAFASFRSDIQLSAKPLYARVSAPLLSQVIFNVVNNACQAMAGTEGGSISITSRYRGEDRREVVIEVLDTGKGIAPEALPYVFDPFFTTKPQAQGTGLGLSLSRSIIMRFGGSISAESELGKGAKFTIVLPAEDKPK